jgi:hypothetical protein
MSTRRSILFPAVIVILLLTIMGWYGKRRSDRPSLAPSTGELARPETASTRPSGAAPAPGPDSSIISNTANVSNQPSGTKSERLQGVLSTYNDVPIDFYGKLEDQFGSAVESAEIRGSIRVVAGVRQGTEWLTSRSDANGLFQFHGKGQDISIVPSKDGYALASLNGGGNYSMLTSPEERAHPDPANPVVIKMWKLHGAEPLVTLNERFKLRYTSEPIYIDVLTGTLVSSGGDVKLTVNRSPGIISGHNRLDWGIQIEAVEGGLMNSDGQEKVTYSAPEGGYQPSMTFTFSTNAPYKWFGGFDQGFFLKSRGGQIYAKIGLSFNINDDPDGLMNFGFRGVANTNSSRNWEGDPNTMKPQ